MRSSTIVSKYCLKSKSKNLEATASIPAAPMGVMPAVVTSYQIKVGVLFQCVLFPNFLFHHGSKSKPMFEDIAQGENTFDCTRTLVEHICIMRQ
jgi:hypothetical protein